MPGMSKNWFFEPHDDGAGSKHDDDNDDSAPGLTCVPAAVLQRHGARVLDPSNAAAVPYSRESGSDGNRARTPNSTVYRARTLLIPADLLGNDSPVVGAINSVLANVGMGIVVPDRPVRGDGPGTQLLERLPRPVVLVPAAPEQGKPVLPVVVDAWVALQALRAAADVATQDDVLRKEVVSRIKLEHLLIGSAVIAGSPSTDGNGVSGSPSTDGNGVTGPTSTNSYAYAGGDTRAPVAVALRRPARRPLKKCGPRRPVVAVLDTGIRAHPWLDVRPEPPGVKPTKDDGFVQIDPGVQDTIYADTKAVEQEGDQPRQLIKGPWDRPDTADPLIGELETTVGHSTFISGIARQVAPDAQVLAIRIMHSDGVVNEYDLIESLSLLANQIASAEAGDMAKMVDVVSLSLGYFDESPADELYSSGLWQVIKVLLDLGVAVVAAAGNFSTRRRFYPAAFTMLPLPGPVPLISVGALNPNGTRALFSDDGRWVRAWAKGASVVSTYPYDIAGDVSPQIEMKGREALDPDDYLGGFATWSGTSFAAPLLAARLARQLLDDAADPGLALDQPGKAAATNRTMTALQKMGWPG
jgi:Subtilase family